MTTTPLWQPSQAQIDGAEITRFRKQVEKDWGVELADTRELWKFSVTELEKFWTSIWDDAGVIAETRGERVLVDGDKMPGAKWFPDARLNFAENLLKHRGDGEAMVFNGEGKVSRRLSFDDVYDQVSIYVQVLEGLGVGEGDRVCGYLPNMPETVIAMAAANALGAVWSSCSPDFGEQGVLDRFGQIEPKVMFCTDGYWYNGKRHDVREKTAAIARQLPSLEKVILIPYGDEDAEVGPIENAQVLGDAARELTPEKIAFRQLPFDHPLYIMFSSGTTGAPKCIVHCQGGTLLKHASEQPIHCDIRQGDRVFFFTTCGWMMWNWLATNIAWGATLLLYDGSPFYPSGNVLFDFADAEKMTLFGTSAKFIDALNKAELRPRDTHDLSSVRVLCSTGSPLAPEGFDYVYDAVKPDIHLVSFSGGTDLMGCFCGGDPTGPVWRGEIQMRFLGMAVDVFDDEGNSIQGEKGELVCTKPFPTVPLGFLNDPSDQRFRSAYFEMFPNIWTHGDYIMLTEHDGIVIYGRSDATLNPGGVRIGTAEIYRQVEKLDEIQESIVIGQEWDNDVRVVLFVVLKEGELDDALTQKIRTQIRNNCTPRHVPAKVVQVADIPRTKSGKITELAVRDIVHGRGVKNKEALANPEALDLFRDLEELKS
ncbi:MAG: acetoacetate--CoA ligase [Rhodospirillales bacterium]|nr:acetoacetate--CoA ligase [Rhodospirillales bacterium]MBO6787825.1 acetoacetate--CoA ligase [Rhodospirillales bacterium]